MNLESCWIPLNFTTPKNSIKPFFEIKRKKLPNYLRNWHTMNSGELINRNQIWCTTYLLGNGIRITSIRFKNKCAIWMEISLCTLICVCLQTVQYNYHNPHLSTKFFWIVLWDENILLSKHFPMHPLQENYQQNHLKRRTEIDFGSNM